jgi:predicted TIM-barrel fold metal-dependent hydrolase
MRIDVHQHLMPAFYARAMEANGGDPSDSPLPKWSPELAIDYMDSHQIRTGILSLSAPSVVGWRGKERREMARRVNEYTADLVAKRPARFGNFATVPLPDVEGSLEEIAYAFDVLQADGVLLLANYLGKYLGDPAFEPIWAELSRRQAVVLVHPGVTPGQPSFPPADGIPSPLLDFLLHTARAAVQLVFNGVIDRYPAARIILSHAGGFMPYAALRVAGGVPHFRTDLADPAKTLARLKHFYFDTALSSGSAIPALKDFAAPDRILFGSDFPYAPPDVAAYFIEALDANAHLDSAERTAINSGNALALFPRLAPSYESPEIGEAESRHGALT